MSAKNTGEGPLVNPEYPEELPYRRILDHGFVALIDVMGGDASIVQAARVSYGKGTKTMRSDKALISYLMRHSHNTPSEMVEFKFLMRIPLFIARQVIRHRTACLAGDTALSFDLPGAERRGRRHHLAKTIAEFHRLWHEGAVPIRISRKKPTYLDRVDSDETYTAPELARLVQRRSETIRHMIRRGDLEAEKRSGRLFVQGRAWHRWAESRASVSVPMRDRLRRMKLRMCDEETGEIRHTHVTDIWESGVKPLFRVTLENGYEIKMTKDHRCFTADGWMTLERAVGLNHRADGGVTWNAETPAFAVNGTPAHRSAEWLRSQKDAGASVAEMAERAGVSYHTVRKALKQNGLQFTASERARLSGRSQRGQRRTMRRRKMSAEHLRSIREARSGPRSNFWKGGVTPERANIGRWTREQAARVHERNNYRCVICSSKQELHAHHVDPAWNNAERTRDASNLTSLCQRCHADLHRFNVELSFLRAFETGVDLTSFWAAHPEALPRPERKRKPAVRKLMRAWSRIARIEYAGEEMTYDLEVEGPYHNFVANGFIVHNSVNEYSARYSEVPDRFFVPELGAISTQDYVNRQGRTDLLRELIEALPDAGRACSFVPSEPGKLTDGDVCLSVRAALDARHRAAFLGGDLLPSESYVALANRLLEQFPEQKAKRVAMRDAFAKQNEESYALYKRLMDEGAAREIARCVLPLTMYTEWYWKIDLHNLFHFLRLRMDPHAQLEVRALAEAMATFVKPRVPFAWDAFAESRLDGTFLTGPEKAVLKPVDEDTQRAVLTGLYERGYRRRRLQEVCRKLDMDERLVDEMWPK